MTTKLETKTDGKSHSVHNLAFGNLSFSDEKPVFEDKLLERQHIKEHMAGAFRIFGRRGYNEGPAGHMSVRDPLDEETFWINPLGVHFSAIKVSDLVHVNANGQILSDGNQSSINAAGFRIHAELHRARPDVNAACHAHTVYGKAWAAFGKKLDMINQDACIFYNCHAVYDSFGGVVFEKEEGKRLARALGNNKAMILQNHGLLTVGETIDEAGYLFDLLERTCQVQLQVEVVARASGLDKKIIGESEAAFTYYNTSNPESLYSAFQPDYKLELDLTGGQFLK
ncbi:hypothetical protein ZYGR_0AF04880 [Zygosaccharomyces rouxii]|uniref:Class II aldolase/adducin N-terminal domain-containing protein n=1 Tax=Zygosaccharomyces rouxii TaxID=4956 RepID=A0A1Q3A8D0_ZYGRO|nr:hypothetical protein ZYGR_0AF04880 [Zygosaccharomyces rouxii]